MFCAQARAGYGNELELPGSYEFACQLAIQGTTQWLQLLRFLREDDIQNGREFMYSWAARHGKRCILEWAFQRGLPWSEDLAGTAAAAGVLFFQWGLAGMSCSSMVIVVGAPDFYKQAWM
jgi:hypothetical protein